jgi:hypothetical protein
MRDQPPRDIDRDWPGCTKLCARVEHRCEGIGRRQTGESGNCVTVRPLTAHEPRHSVVLVLCRSDPCIMMVEIRIVKAREYLKSSQRCGGG